ncbi:hypothetical protein N0V83_007090 [Neocucurbitaria cava]|uniref:Uncharacterized protein n=1 Tax=Neocucurbitaria cava TaxID=798079 RepID=A0A9W8Y6Y6_9PLEO|nr:hypothetical protein N0V83_007090 [Neocucurbitaria cava]
MSAWEASGYTSGSTTAWESENEEPIAELMEDIFHALDRLQRRDTATKRATESAFPRHHLATDLSECPPPAPVPSPELWTPASRSYGIPPPSYDESIADVPPDYTSTDALASVRTPECSPFPSLNASLCSEVPNCLRISNNTSPTSSLFFDEKSLYADIDFGYSDAGIKSHAKKNNKKNAAKKAPAASSPVDDGDKKKEEETAGSGGDSGGDPPADGGAGVAMVEMEVAGAG